MLLVFQNEEIFAHLDELDKLDNPKNYLSVMVRVVDCYTSDLAQFLIKSPFLTIFLLLD